jgi:hypothetical protein
VRYPEFTSGANRGVCLTGAVTAGRSNLNTITMSSSPELNPCGALPRDRSLRHRLLERTSKHGDANSVSGISTKAIGSRRADFIELTGAHSAQDDSGQDADRNPG